MEPRARQQIKTSAIVAEKTIPILPVEIWCIIFTLLGEEWHFIAALVCKSWYDILKHLREKKGRSTFYTTIRCAFATPKLAMWAQSFFQDPSTHANPFYLRHFAPENIWKSFAAGGNMALCRTIVNIEQFAIQQNRIMFMIILAKNGHCAVLKWLYAINPPLFRDFFHTSHLNCLGEYATASNNIPLLEWLRSIGCIFTETAYREAVIYRNYRVIDWLQTIGCPRDTFAIHCAVCHDDIKMVRHLAVQGFPLDEDCVLEAIEKENLEMVKTLCEIIARLPVNEHFALPNVCEQAAAKGSVSILRYLREQGCPWNEETFAAAAGSGSFPVLRYLRKQGCPFDTTSLTAAAENGHSGVIKWLTEVVNCPRSPDAIAMACRFGKLKLVKYMYNRIYPLDANATREAAENNRMDILRYLFEQIEDPMVEDDLPLYAVQGGHIRVLDYLRSLNLPEDDELDWDDHLFDMAASEGHQHVLEWLSNEGFFVTPETLDNAIENGNFHLIPTLYILGAFMEGDEYIQALFAHAPRNILQWVYENDQYTQHRMVRDECAMIAATNGNLPAIQWLRDEGLVLVHQVFDIAAQNNRVEIVDWGRKIGYLL